jgi:cytochrome c oxidase subunit II
VSDSNSFNWGLPPASSSYAGEVDFLMSVIHWVMTAMFVLWGIYFVFCLVAYRQQPGGKATYHQTGEKLSFIPDAGILLFELWLIFAFGIPIWTRLKQQTPPPAESLRVNLVAQQFAWNFHYPGPDGKFGRRSVDLVSASNLIGLDDADPASKDDVITINNLYVPVNKPVVLQMTSKDVIHNFAVAEFRNKHDVVPGLDTMYWFEAIQTGKFEIGCSQLCGNGHTKMRGDVIVQTAAEYDAWLKAQIAEKAGQASAPKGDAAAS